MKPLRRAVRCAAFLAAAASGLAATAVNSAEVRNYRADLSLRREATSQRRVVVLRSFEQDGVARHLIADPETLVTRVTTADAVAGDKVPWTQARTALAGTAYGRVLADEAAREGAPADAGLTHVRPGSSGVNLTVDLCPSLRPMDREVFRALIEELGRVQRPVPVAIAITGVWMKRHPEDLDWLRSLADAGTLAITWINHSYTHRVGEGRPLAESFLLDRRTNLAYEVLATERLLIERGLVPSVFFRFPGLVSDRKVFDRILSYGLLPVGSDAWLAKGQKPQPGSIVLVHANGNEPLGVRRFLELLRQERERVRSGRWLLLDLRESVAETEAARPRQ